jgi:uncharacterized protein YsxB (DUF464 family)
MALKMAGYAGLGEDNGEVVCGGQRTEEDGRDIVCGGRRLVVGDGGAEVAERSRDIRVEN